jgi:heme exporter protein D
MLVPLVGIDQSAEGHQFVGGTALDIAFVIIVVVIAVSVAVFVLRKRRARRELARILERSQRGRRPTDQALRERW